MTAKRFRVWSVVYYTLALAFTVGAVIYFIEGRLAEGTLALQSSSIVILALWVRRHHDRIETLERERRQIPSITLEVTNAHLTTMPFTATLVGSEKLKN